MYDHSTLNCVTIMSYVTTFAAIVSTRTCGLCSDVASFGFRRIIVIIYDLI